MNSRVRTTMTIEGEVDAMRGIKDMGAGTNRKEYSSSSNPGKKQKTSVSQGYPGKAEVIRTKARMGHLVRQGR